MTYFVTVGLLVINRVKTDSEGSKKKQFYKGAQCTSGRCLATRFCNRWRARVPKRDFFTNNEILQYG